MNTVRKDINMGEVRVKDAEVVDEVPKKSAMDRAEDGQQAVNRVMSFVDWIRYVFDWIRGLFGR